MKPDDATQCEEVPDDPGLYSHVKLERPRFRIPRDVKRQERFDEILGPRAWSVILTRDNGLGECGIHTDLNLILTGFVGAFLFTDSEGRTEFIRGHMDILGLLPGTYKLRTINGSGVLSFVYCMAFDDATAHKWYDWGYLSVSTIRPFGDPPKSMHRGTLQ